MAKSSDRKSKGAGLSPNAPLDFVPWRTRKEFHVCDLLSRPVDLRPLEASLQKYLRPVHETTAIGSNSIEAKNKLDYSGEDHRQNVIDGRLWVGTGAVSLKARRRMTPMVRARELERTGLAAAPGFVGTCARLRVALKNDQGLTQNVRQLYCWTEGNPSYLIPSTQDVPDTSRGSLRAVM